MIGIEIKTPLDCKEDIIRAELEKKLGERYDGEYRILRQNAGRYSTKLVTFSQVKRPVSTSVSA